jgi:hypothetical protein
MPPGEVHYGDIPRLMGSSLDITGESRTVGLVWSWLASLGELDHHFIQAGLIGLQWKVSAFREVARMSGLRFSSHPSPVYGQRGMVAASQPLAVAAGLEILAAGGNAADAAVATAAALNVTEPTSTGIGGDCFALFYDAAIPQITALNGSGRAPAALTLERLQREGFGVELPPNHPYTITVPGACAGWCDLVERHGRPPLGRKLVPVLRQAERNFRRSISRSLPRSRLAPLDRRAGRAPRRSLASSAGDPVGICRPEAGICPAGGLRRAGSRVHPR